MSLRNQGFRWISRVFFRGRCWRRDTADACGSQPKLTSGQLQSFGELLRRPFVTVVQAAEPREHEEPTAIHCASATPPAFACLSRDAFSPRGSS